MCYGTTTGALVGLGVLFSYLLLFDWFYVQTYSKSRSEEATKKDQLKIQSHALFVVAALVNSGHVLELRNSAFALRRDKAIAQETMSCSMENDNCPQAKFSQIVQTTDEHL